ncbi:predicted protein [Enterococcus faecalis ATCC 4200]|nr:predicted protein [Enterococcus faecalis ATCC 4200]
MNITGGVCGFSEISLKNSATGLFVYLGLMPLISVKLHQFCFMERYIYVEN